MGRKSISSLRQQHVSDNKKVTPTVGEGEEELKKKKNKVGEEERDTASEGKEENCDDQAGEEEEGQTHPSKRKRVRKRKATPETKEDDPSEGEVVAANDRCRAEQCSAYSEYSGMALPSPLLHLLLLLFYCTSPHCVSPHLIATV